MQYGSHRGVGQFMAVPFVWPCICAHIAESASLAVPIVWHLYYTPELASSGGLTHIADAA